MDYAELGQLLSSLCTSRSLLPGVTSVVTVAPCASFRLLSHCWGGRRGDGGGGLVLLWLFCLYLLLLFVWHFLFVFHFTWKLFGSWTISSEVKQLLQVLLVPALEIISNTDICDGNMMLMVDSLDSELFFSHLCILQQLSKRVDLWFGNEKAW